MTEPDEARSSDVPTRMSYHQSRFFWTATAVAIAAMLVLCAALILIAATRT